MSAAVQSLPGAPGGEAEDSRAERMGELMDCADALKAICKGVLPDYLSATDLERLSVAESLAYAAGVLSERMAGLLEDFEAAERGAR